MVGHLADLVLVAWKWKVTPAPKVGGTLQQNFSRWNWYQSSFKPTKSWARKSLSTSNHSREIIYSLSTFHAQGPRINDILNEP